MKVITRAIELKGIQKNYRIGDSEFAILKGIDLEIDVGEFIALMGPSGSGKSTLMNIVGCLDRPSSGRFILLGQDISQTLDDELARIRREELGFIFQTFNLIGRISVLKNVEIPMMLSGVARERRRSRALELLESVGIAHRSDFSPTNISGGERQRVAIARALANDPKIIIADEPTGNLDLKNSEEVMKILSHLNRDGRTIIMVTHNPEITGNCSRVIRLRDGRILESAS
ncbi:MAG: putative ABC transport system ATP-binding protein [Methanosaeta sp. ASP1-1]|nr:ABC transporter ATP-binding protein [Methanothrix sp.]OYV08499.1 MAG: putative ABC transport system ATP-binding protein [Methanosaeta sp. ASP1-1]OYV10438.1 MAG: putative ABC transport system ATP-binding protein [Methanosaeta sp. ASO1]OYV11871.1 MAG: putative ABC transport system ATP-binding protein [Methanosaeta sp. NSM2]MDD1731768.1 ABC transporter ATP-binding protein [Methanothrix sp.]